MKTYLSYLYRKTKRGTQKIKKTHKDLMGKERFYDD